MPINPTSCRARSGAPIALAALCALAAPAFGFGAPDEPVPLAESLNETGHRAPTPLSTDRPDFTEAVDAVGAGRLQIESGYTFTRERSTDTHGFPETLVRFGVLDRVELRFEWAGWNWIDAGGPGARDDGHNDISIGAKVAVLEQDGLIPALSVIARTSIPTGEPGIGADDFEPEGKLVWAYDVTEGLSLSGNLNLALPVSDRGRYFEPAASVSLAFDLTDMIGAYVEYFGFYPVDRGGPARHSVNTGLTFLLTPDLQLDLRIGAGLSDAADDLFAGAGISVRF